jgi:LacI family transcriptional regulator
VSGRPRTSPVTITDVARAAGVSIKTVSRVINAAGYVRDATRHRVARAIQRLGYRPNALARGLVTGRSRSIGLVIADVVNPFFPPLVRAVEDVAAARGYTVILADTDEDAARERGALSVLLEKQVDGLILCASRVRAGLLRRIADSGVPLAMINRALSHPRAIGVVADGVVGGRLATEHLLRLGHTRIAYLAGPRASASNRNRFRGYRDALAARGIPFQPSLVAGGVPSLAGGMEAMASLLAAAPGPTAVFAFDDLMALGALAELRRRRIRVPEDMALVGYDNIDLAGFIDPALTTVDQPKAQMGQLAATLLLDLIETGSVPRPRTRVLMPRLIVRASCGGTPAVTDSARGAAT